MGRAFKLDNEVLYSNVNSLSEDINNHKNNVASNSTLGHVKIGTGLSSSSDGTISVSYGKTAGTACQGNDDRLTDSRTPNPHAASSTTYGGATATNYGHVKLSDNYTSSAGKAAESVGASSKAVYDAYNSLKTSFQGGVDTIYNAFVSAGTTPAGKTPANIATAVNDLISSVKKGNATADKVLTGYTFSSAYAGVNVYGTMKDNGAWKSDTSGNGNIYIPSGYHSGGGYVSGSGAYNAGVTAADNRSNPNSANYKSGYNAGVAAADNRSNPDSANYKAGYDAGRASKKIYNLGTGTSSGSGSSKKITFDVRRVPGYSDFTANNFIITAGTSWANAGQYGSRSNSATPTKSYSNGILTVSGLYSSGTWDNGGAAYTGTLEVEARNVRAYLVVGGFDSL